MILMYHKVDLESPTIWWVDVNNFYRQMCELKCKKVVYLDDYDPNDPNQVVITFDGVYQDIYKYALPILQKFGYPFELFISSDYIGRDNNFDAPEPLTNFCNKEELRLLIKGGGRLQWHTRSHPDLSKVTDEKVIEKEVVPAYNLKLLDKKGFKWFAYPYGTFSDQIVEVVKKYFIGAVSCIQGNDTDQYVLNRVTVENKTSFKKASIAVIIASYNYGCFLVEAIESVLRQIRVPDEILISDDCSSDNTAEIGETYAKKYPNLIKFNRNKTNLGVVRHFNKAIGMTKSDYICFLGADNRFRSDYIKKVAEVLDTNSDVAVAYTDFALFGARASFCYSRFPENERGPILHEYYYLIHFPDFNDQSRSTLKVKNFIHGSSLYRRKAFKEVGGYTEVDNQQEDHDLFLRMINNGWTAKRIPEPLLEYRQHGRGQVNNTLNSYAEMKFYKDQFYQVRDELNKIHSSKFWKLLFIYKNPREGLKRYGLKLTKMCFRLALQKMRIF